MLCSAYKKSAADQLQYVMHLLLSATSQHTVSSAVGGIDAVALYRNAVMAFGTQEQKQQFRKLQEE